MKVLPNLFFWTTVFAFRKFEPSLSNRHPHDQNNSVEKIFSNQKGEIQHFYVIYIQFKSCKPWAYRHFKHILGLTFREGLYPEGILC